MSEDINVDIFFLSIFGRGVHFTILQTSQILNRLVSANASKVMNTKIISTSKLKAFVLHRFEHVLENFTEISVCTNGHTSC